ncbi:hypothetical protein [Streptomyces sp. BK205]|uniref:hypothetical protein n=1 Tax=Streptomyces sp. BK205 TaxID=2512164 RepID=UPI0010F1CB59|nr:hypothetical protein [Streptomyces sp. BK205]TCR15621.1 hypothetical protein EV578_11643 [Streptomyces sp. BK205]
MRYATREFRPASALVEAQHGGGPCLESYGSGRPVPPVSIRVAHAAARRPGFTDGRSGTTS